MFHKMKCFLLITCVFIFGIECKKVNRRSTEDKDGGKSSLAFIFDTTGSMYNDLRQLREGAEMILNTALQESGVIADFVFVPFHDPLVGPVTVTKNKRVFQRALNMVHVQGGGDCPEKSLTGIQLALNVSRPRSFLYVFTDATATDHRIVGKVLDAIQRKQSQVVFILTGHCNDLKRPSYKVYQQVAAASSGQIFNLNKTNVHMMLDFVKNSIKGRTVNLASVSNPPGYNYTQEIPVDSTLGEVTVSVSGAKPKISVIDPNGEKLTGPPKLITTLDLSEIMIVKVMQPEPGNWTVTVGSEKEHSVKVVGLSNVTFNHGFSVEQPKSMKETSYRPLKGTYNHMLISLSPPNVTASIQYAQILTLDGRSLFELPLKQIDNNLYSADPFIPPDDFFYIAINGQDKYKQDLRRIGATAIQAQLPDVPYLTASRKVEAHSHSRVVLSCSVESLVPVTAMWTKDGTKMYKQITSFSLAGIGARIGVATCAAPPPELEANVRYVWQKARWAAQDISVTAHAAHEEEPLLGTKLVELFSVYSREQTTSIDFVIENMKEEDVGTYRCIAHNMAGVSRTSTVLDLIVEPPQITMEPENTTELEVGDTLTISCTVYSEALLLENRLIFNGSQTNYSMYAYTATEIDKEPKLEGVYPYKKTIKIDSDTVGLYTCIAANRGGKTNQTTLIKLKADPTAQILGPHTLSKKINSSMQLVCTVDNAGTVVWTAPNGTVVRSRDVTGPTNDMLEVKNVTNDGEWTCSAVRGSRRGMDKVSVNVLIKPVVSIIGSKNITILNATVVEVTCEVVAKPSPRILWHRETETFLNNTIKQIQPNVYRSVLKLNSSADSVAATYFCFGENSEGIHQDSLTVHVRRKMKLLHGFEDQSVQLYYQVELQCVIDSYPLPNTIWYHNGTELVTNSNVHVSEDNSTVYLKRIEFNDLGGYTCIADNGYENIIVTGTIGVTGLAAPVISKELTKITARSGNSTKITCRVLKGSPEPTISWEFKKQSSEEFATLPDGVVNNEKELILSNTAEEQSGVYRCTAVNVIGKDVYDVILVVQYPPRIDSTLEGVNKPREVKLGNEVKFSCKTEGSPPPILVWTKDTRPLVYSDNILLSDTNELSIKSVSAYDSGTYTCTATSTVGSTHKDFTLIVYDPPKVTSAPETLLEVLEGQRVELPCSAQGVPLPIVEWTQNGAPLSDHRKYVDEYGLSANDIGNLYITQVKHNHEGLYVCVAENNGGIAEKSTYLKVNEPPKILEDNYTGPYLATTMDTALTIACRATGKPKPYVVWSKDEFYLNNGVHERRRLLTIRLSICVFINLSNIKKKLYNNQSMTVLDPRYTIDLDGTLTIKSPSEDMSGNYTCTVKNSIGVVNKTVPVEIYSIPVHSQSEESLSSLTLVEGTNATVECPVTGSHSLKWYKNANVISSGTLLLTNVSRHNTSTYTCVARNVVGSAYAKVQIVVEWPPAFVDHTSTSVEVLRGDDWYFDCAADAKPRAKTKWMFKSKPLVFEDKPRLKMINIQPHNAGEYKCIVSNVHGTAIKLFSLNVLIPPFISEFDMLDVQLKEGVNATLQCNARGTPQPTLTWTYNNTNWHEQNSQLSSTNITRQSEGIYRCDAVNKAGATHIVYRVTIVARSEIQDIVAFTNGEGVNVEGSVEVVQGSRLRVTCKAAGNPIPDIQWIHQGRVVSENSYDIDYADLILNDVQLAQNGLYTCVASNEGGTHEKKIKIDVLEPPKIFQELFQNANVTSNEVHLEVISGQSFYLHCHPYGNPQPEIYWFKDDLPLKFFDDAMVSTDFGEVIVAKKAVQEQSGNYTCVARNKVGNTSVVYLVDVLVPPPSPKESTKKMTIGFGKPLVLTCPAVGSPLPSVMWVKHPYSEISGNDRVHLTDDNFTMVINKTEVTDGGKYSCIMTNKVGTTEVIYDVTIHKPPSIAGNAGNNLVEGHVVALKRSIVLKCEADGHPMPKITWLKDTQILSESLANIQRVLGNSLLAIWSANVRDAGQYICVVENEAGTAHRRYNVAIQDSSSKSEKIILDQTACRGPTVDKRRCHMPPCDVDESKPRWSMWSQWSECSATCGVGTQARTRRCKTKAKCEGDNVQIKKCPDLPLCSPALNQNNVNEVIDNNTNNEDNSDPDSYLPDLTYEIQPETINSYSSPDVEEFYSTSGSQATTVFFDVSVTENLDHSDRGPCDPGYRHNASYNTCEDIDECLFETNQCHSTQVCVNTDGAYRCSCTPGYLALAAGQRCLDINECELETDGCSHSCVNTAGGYACACPRHLRLHIDKHHCVTPALYRRPLSELESEYLSTTIDFPTKYTKTIRNTKS
ncbi:unnamed protein product [Spodoptera littoralis]|uniref:Hemolin n=1 Tax=Spodoptera littoralis TaxID=7109 RepID=A0A9P0HVY4_SPOLI|nr:unnamed protein product [Spodoptera littoralis]CAH1634825.1 unnamed protein product [Spodoptera littoralis]